MAVQIDDKLFSDVEVLLSEQHILRFEERRYGTRRHYDCTQLLAPFDEEHLPQQADFRQVRCRDLSPSGFSFFSYRRPDTEQVVVALGAIPFSFFVAEVVHAKLVDGEIGQEFLVGCRFVRRLGD